MMHFTIEQRIANLTRYYNRVNERPLLGFFLDSEYPLRRYRASASLPEERPLRPDDFVCADYLPDNERLFNLHEEAGGDFIWAASAFWGIPWLEVMLGCEAFADHGSGSIHTRIPNAPCVLEFDSDNAWARKAKEFLTEFSRHASGRYPLAVTRMRGIADLLAAMLGNEAFILNFMQEPDQVKRLCERLTDHWIAFGKFQLEQIPLFHGGVGSFYYNMWAPVGSLWHQEDAVALLNPGIYRKFIEPCDRRIAQSFGGCFMHMHPTGFYPYRQLLDASMTILELHIDAGGPSAEQLFDVHKEILAHKPMLIWGDIGDEDLEWIFLNLPRQGLAVQKVVKNAQEAEYVWNMSERLWNRS